VITTSAAGRRLSTSAVVNEVERADASLAQFLSQRLDANAKRRREAFDHDTAHNLTSDDRCLAILVGVRVNAVAVLEIDPVILDGFSRELVSHAAVDRTERRMPRNPERSAQGLGGWCVFVE
jgi:hypothetical protein